MTKFSSQVRKFDFAFMSPFESFHFQLKCIRSPLEDQSTYSWSACAQWSWTREIFSNQVKSNQSLLSRSTVQAVRTNTTKIQMKTTWIAGYTERLPISKQHTNRNSATLLRYCW